MENWQHKINTIGEIVTDAEDVGQCLETIATTQKGSVPHNPNLGWDFMKYQDKPVNIVTPKMKLELSNAFKTQEPRAEINSLEFSYKDSGNGHLYVNIFYSFKNETKGVTSKLW